MSNEDIMRQAMLAQSMGSQPGFWQSMQAQGWNNPLLNIGMGILAANKPGASFGQAVGGGGLLGMQNYQASQYQQARMDELQRKREEEDRARQAQMQQQERLEQWLATLPPQIQQMYRANPELAMKVLESQMVPKEPVSLGPGSVLVDPATGRQVASAPFKPEGPMSVSPGNQVVDPATGRVIYTAPEGKSGPDVKGEGDLRNEYGKLMRDFEQIELSFNKINDLAQSPSAAGDMALVFSFMKMLDPGSTVREGEYASAENARGVGQEIRGLYNRLMEGQILTPSQRRDFVRQANTLYQVNLRKAERINKRYRGLAENYDYDPTRIIQDLNTAPTTPKQPTGEDPLGIRR